MTQNHASKLSPEIDTLIRNALKEDIGSGDITTSSTIPAGHVSVASFISKGRFTVAGLPFVKRTFMLVDKGLRFKIKTKEGTSVKRGVFSFSSRACPL